MESIILILRPLTPAFVACSANSLGLFPQPCSRPSPAVFDHLICSNTEERDVWEIRSHVWHQVDRG